MRAAAQLARMGGATGARYAGLTRMERTGPVWTGEVRVREDLLTWPLFRRQPRRIAVDNMSDLFHETLTTATIDRLHAVIAVAHWHSFLVLTKRARRMRDYYRDPDTPRRIAEEVTRLSSAITPSSGGRRRAAPGAAGFPRHWLTGFSRVKYNLPSLDTTQSCSVGLDPWPLPNLWPAVSVEDQDRMTRVYDLIETPAAIRWVCFEPLLNRVRPDAVPAGEGFFDALRGGHYALDGRGRVVALDGPARRPLDWVVAGGEIGAGARPTHPAWVRKLRDQCVAAGVPFFFRQWGEWAPTAEDRPDQTVVRIGRHAAGRLIDGRTWDEMPSGARTS